METNPSGIVGLSTELIFLIIDYADPYSHLALALTCSILYHRSLPILDRHRAAHRVASDLQPENVLKLLRFAVVDSLEAWHVRELELWGNRVTWDDWRDWDVALTGQVRLADTELVKPRLERKEILSFFSMARQWWDIPEHEFDAARNELENGGDGFLKLLLIASCPKLHTIRFAQKEKGMHTSLRWMSKAVSWSMDSERWPPGFQSLRNVAMGVSAGVPKVYDDSDDDEPSLDFVDFAAALNLPAIHSIYISDLYPSREDDEDIYDEEMAEKYRLKPRSSTVQHIYIDRAEGLNDYFEAFLGVGEDLQSMTVRAIPGFEFDDTDHIPCALKKNYPDTFRNMTFYNPEGLHGYRCGAYLPDELDPFPGLRQMSVGRHDIELLASGCVREGPNVQEYVDWWRNECLPENIEVVMIWGDTKGWFHDLTKGLEPIDLIDVGVAGMIKSGNCKNLKVIYLDDIESETKSQRERVCFQKSIAAGGEMGVHVYTLTNRDDGGYGKGFPIAPDKFDMKTGPFGERPASWRINRRTGEREDPGCQGCGLCDECLRVYPEEVWKTAAASLAKGLEQLDV
ncbi:hypothetical protein ACHAPT_004868 [Fusarium lateritium]